MAATSKASTLSHQGAKQAGDTPSPSLSCRALKNHRGLRNISTRNQRGSIGCRGMRRRPTGIRPAPTLALLAPNSRQTLKMRRRHSLGTAGLRGLG